MLSGQSSPPKYFSNYNNCYFGFKQSVDWPTTTIEWTELSNGLTRTTGETQCMWHSQIMAIPRIKVSTTDRLNWLLGGYGTTPERKWFVYV